MKGATFNPQMNVDNKPPLIYLSSYYGFTKINRDGSTYFQVRLNHQFPIKMIT